MICIEDLRYRTLDIPHISLPNGIIAVTGDNGAGKTTLLRLAVGMELPEHGRITIDGVPPRDCEVGYVSEFPDRHLIFSVVREEIASPLRFAHKTPEEISAAVAKTAELFEITHLLDCSCRTLSGGEKMLTGIAAALAAEPVLLVLDEPDSHLDPETTVEIVDRIQTSGCPQVLWSTHSRKVQERADRVLVLSNGRVVNA